ncbi:Glycosyl transferase family 2 [Psychrobacter pasteurii]|uniref:Glycosyl transferase family 2 n=1 Tax=Psychrobacter pasteurii TaxID=1945520 RepID=A0A1R4EG79_9GAMM|nr:glycosyltransferase [Psychrobacter pasteurii]SJM37472.1 Glycosyl transferase family 2 [Psychrobacter pasteurii]
MSLCLNMIVKDESHIIEATLHNICQHFPITYWAICDTGSSDNTIELIEQFFQKKGIQGHIYREPWKNFSHNRNVALKQCVGKSDYVLIFDADDHVTGEINLPNLDPKTGADSYLMQFTSESGAMKYLRKLIIKNDSSYSWRGVLHEFIQCNRSETVAQIQGDYAIVSGRKGNRSLDKNKYQKDAQILKDAFIEAQDSDLLPRYAFYCAQSYRDAAMIDEAIKWYKKRIEIKAGWADERYCSYVELGLLYERKKDFDQALHYWQQGIVHDPKRAECWYHMARRHSWSKHTELAYVFGRQAAQLPMPTGNRLFLAKNIYHYWSAYEWCINAYKLGHYEESYQAFKQLVTHCPQDLLQKVAHQMSSYKHLVLQDSFAEVSTLTLNLNRLNQTNLLHELLSNEPVA